jgi:hypothetical protein
VLHCALVEVLEAAILSGVPEVRGPAPPTPYLLNPPLRNRYQARRKRARGGGLSWLALLQVAEAVLLRGTMGGLARFIVATSAPHVVVRAVQTVG